MLHNTIVKSAVIFYFSADIERVTSNMKDYSNKDVTLHIMPAPSTYII
jgi:hypothetical protein